MKETKFIKWAKDYGVARLVADMRSLGPDCAVTFSAVYQHLRGDVEPRPTKIRGYVRLAAGKLSLGDVHKHIESVRAARLARMEAREAMQGALR